MVFNSALKGLTLKKGNIFSDGEDSSTVTNYMFLVDLITNVSDTNKETKKRMSFSKAAMANLAKIIKVLEVSTNKKGKLLYTTVFPAMLYGCRGKQIKRKTDNTIYIKKDKCISD